MKKIAFEAVSLPSPKASIFKGEDIAKTIGRFLVSDEKLAKYSEKGFKASLEISVFGLGRIARYLAKILRTEKILDNISIDVSFGEIIYQVLSGDEKIDKKKAELLEAMIVASIDHGVTPPSTQSTLIAASVRAPFEVAISQGIGAITDVHGGAGTKAVYFFKKCLEIAKEKQMNLSAATFEVITEYVRQGNRVQGLGHRIHTKDPRRDILWAKADAAGVAADSVKISKNITEIFKQARGIDLPINVDGVIGAIIADLNLNPLLAKAVFIFGRTAGLAAHYFEEIMSQPQMRRINFSEAIYKGKE
jgi:citrate synthase